MGEKSKKEVKKPKKESWFDFEKAMLLLLILALFILLKTAFTPPETENLFEEASVVLATITSGSTEVSLVDSDEKLIEEKIRNLDAMDYDKIKNVAGVEGDFCVFLEDGTGNLVMIDETPVAIGSEKIAINGYHCR